MVPSTSPVSSLTSRTAASAGASPIFIQPPGNCHTKSLPVMRRLPNSTLFLWVAITATATRGTGLLTSTRIVTPNFFALVA